MDKDKIKKLIADKARNLNNNNGEVIKSPIVLTMYLGKLTESVVDASLVDAFSTSFVEVPKIGKITIEAIDTKDLTRLIVEQLKELNIMQIDYYNINFAFISLMDDPVFGKSNIDEICMDINSAFQNLSSYGIGTTNISFYGIFRQEKMQAEYQNAYKFINDGKGLWKKIYHLEQSIVANDINREAFAIAVSVINEMNNHTNSNQQQDSENYSWKSISVDYLKLNEFIISKVLEGIYAYQLSGMLDEMFKNNIKSSLSAVLDEELNKPVEDGIEQYVPLKFQEDREEKKVGFWGMRSRTVENTYHDIIKDDISLDYLYEEVCPNISEMDINNIIKKIFYKMTNVNMKDTIAVSNILQTVLAEVEIGIDKQISESSSSYEIYKNREIGKPVNNHIKEQFNIKKDLLVLNKKKDLISCIKQCNCLNPILEDIKKINTEYKRILSELRLYEYGGAEGETLESGEFACKFKLNEPIENVIKDLDETILSRIVCNVDMITRQLNKFINNTKARVTTYHTLGVVMAGESVTPQQTILLNSGYMTNNTILSSINDISQTFQNIFRENVFIVISSRRYGSNESINRYK